MALDIIESEAGPGHEEVPRVPEVFRFVRCSTRQFIRVVGGPHGRVVSVRVRVSVSVRVRVRVRVGVWVGLGLGFG